MHKAPDIPFYPLQWIPRIQFHNLSVSLISAPQQVSEIYTTVCPFNFTRFCVNLERWEENYSWFICDFDFLLFFLVHGFVSVDQFRFQMIQILSRYFLFVTGQDLSYFILKVRWALLLWMWKCSSKKPLLGVERQPKFWLTSPRLWASATNANGCEIFSSRVMEGGKELAVSLRIIIPINPFTHLSLGTSEGPKTCQAITQLHRSVHKIFCITLAVICACYIGTSSTCVRWQQRKQLFWETKSISTVAKPCPCLGKSDWEQQHLSIWSGKKVYKTQTP